MRKFLRAACVAAGALAALLGATGWAQVPPSLNPSRRPAVSPYINLLRQGSDPAVNYYGIVRPDITFRSSINQLQQQEAVLTQGQQDLTTAVLPATGHATGFLTQSKYFQTKGARGTAPATPPTGPSAGSLAKNLQPQPRR